MKKTRHKITFREFSDAEAVALAKMGASNAVIMRDTGLTPGQIQYRLRKGKDLEGYEESYRWQYRNGVSETFRRVKEDILAITRQEVQRKLPRILGTKQVEVAAPKPEPPPLPPAKPRPTAKPPLRGMTGQVKPKGRQ